MRDTSEGMIELVGATQPAPQVYACQVRLVISADVVRLQFQVQQLDYVLLKKILTAQPFAPVAAGAYAYYFVGSYRPDDGHGHPDMAIRVEQNNQHKQLWFQATKPLLANLLWLQQLELAADVAQLRY